MPFSKNPGLEVAIVLAGGRGSRLGGLTARVPKPLLPVGGRPFLFQVFDFLHGQGIRRVILATGYLADAFARAVGPQYRGMSVVCSPETVPLGTGGAIAHALRQTDAAHVLVINGDTYFPADVAALFASHLREAAALSLVLRHVPDTARYGRIHVSGDRVVAMEEKGAGGPGLINGGIYLVDRAACLAEAPAHAFSLERELLPSWIAQHRVVGSPSDAFFIDIGVPADLARAQAELA